MDTPTDTISDLLQVERVCSRRSGAACFFLDAGIGIDIDIGIDIGKDIGTDIDTDIGTDVGKDIGTDIGIDIGIDIGTDIGIDIGTDVGKDIGTDIGIDIGTNIGTDIGIDIGIDIGTDTMILDVSTTMALSVCWPAHQPCRPGAAVLTLSDPRGGHFVENWPTGTTSAG